VTTPQEGDRRRQQAQHDKEHDTAERTHRREHEAEAKALLLAVDGIERRLDELNQLRKEVILDRSQFVLHGSYEAEQQAIKVEFRGKHDQQSSRIDALEKVLDRAEGAVNTWRAIAGFLGLGGVGAIIWAIVQSGR
jgi:hypothetical protein